MLSCEGQRAVSLAAMIDPQTRRVHSVPLSLMLAVLLLAAPLHAQSALPVDPVPAHDTFTVTSRALRELRLVNVHVPQGYATSQAAKFPVLYMPDGGVDEDFPHVV